MLGQHHHTARLAIEAVYEIDLRTVIRTQARDQRVDDIDAARVYGNVSGLRNSEIVFIFEQHAVTVINRRLAVPDRVRDLVFFLYDVTFAHVCPIDAHPLILHTLRPSIRSVIRKAVRQKLDDGPAGAVRIDLAGESELLFFHQRLWKDRITMRRTAAAIATRSAMVTCF